LGTEDPSLNHGASSSSSSQAVTSATAADNNEEQVLKFDLYTAYADEEFIDMEQVRLKTS